MERDDDLMSGYNVHQYIDTNTLVARFTSISRYIGLYTSHVERDDDLTSGYNVHQYIDTNTLVARFTSISRYIGLYTSHVQYRELGLS